MSEVLALAWDTRALWIKLALVFAAIAAALRCPRESPWRGSAALLAALLGVNALFDALQVGLSWNAAPHGRGAVAPLFAYFAPRFAWPVAVHAAVALAALAWTPRALDPERSPGPRFALALVAFAFASPPLLAFSSPPEEVFAQFFRSGLDYPRDVPPLAELPAFLRGYVGSMPELGVHARTHAPGALLLLAVIQRAVGTGELAQSLALQLLGSALPLLAWASARRLLDERGARFAALLVAFSPSFQLFSFVSMEAVFALALSGLLAAGAEALFAAERARRWAWIAGVLGYAAAFFSFSVSVVALILALASLRGLWTGVLSRARLQGALWRAAAAALACHAAVFAATGFDLVACFRRALLENEQLIASSWSSAETLVFAALGNLAAFAFACGVPTSAAALRALGLRRGAVDPLAQQSAATAAAIALTLLLGLYLWEVERIWLFLVPPVCASAAGLLAPLGAAQQRRVLAVVWLQSAAAEIALQTWW